MDGDGAFSSARYSSGSRNLNARSSSSAFTPATGHGGETGLAEMERVCRPGGCVAILWPNHLSWLAARGYDPDFGARPLRRVLQREVGDHLAMLLLQGDFESGDTITVDVDGDQLTFR